MVLFPALSRWCPHRKPPISPSASKHPCAADNRPVIGNFKMPVGSVLGSAQVVSITSGCRSSLIGVCHKHRRHKIQQRLPLLTQVKLPDRKSVVEGKSV